MDYRLEVKFSTDSTDDEDVLKAIDTVVTTVLPYMVDNVEVRIFGGPDNPWAPLPGPPARWSGAP